jgi:uncharacterized protein (TIGR03435 family)
MTMAAFSDYLTSHLGRVVVDDTKLSGHCDFTLNLKGTPGTNQLREAVAGSADPGAAKIAWAAAMNDWSGSSVFIDIQKQLGLKLEADKAPVDHLVIDHIDRPTPNLAAFAVVSGRPDGPVAITRAGQWTFARLR